MPCLGFTIHHFLGSNLRVNKIPVGISAGENKLCLLYSSYHPSTLARSLRAFLGLKRLQHEQRYEIWEEGAPIAVRTPLQHSGAYSGSRTAIMHSGSRTAITHSGSRTAIRHSGSRTAIMI